MTEFGELGKDNWERLFPNPERRKFAQAFIQRVSRISSVEKIVTMEVGEGEQKQQRIYVFSKGFGGISETSELNDVMGILLEVCVNKSGQALLGHVPVITESLFQEHREIAPYIKGREITVLWQMSGMQTSFLSALK